MQKVFNILCAGLAILLGVSTRLNTALAEEMAKVMSDEIPYIFIKAVNPGYTTDLGNNVGEMIEIAKKNADESVSLAGITVSYTNSSGKESVLLSFPENSEMSGESVLLRWASSPDSELANATYDKTLAMRGGISLKNGEEVIDEVCWSGEEGCEKEFKSSAPTTLVRNLETGGWETLDEYEPPFAEENYSVPEPEPGAEPEPDGSGGEADTPGHCGGLQFSEVLSYYESEKAEQFVEIHNTGTEEILMDGCTIRYKNKNYALVGTVGADAYFAYFPDANGFSLTKNPTSSNALELIDANGAEVDEMEYSNGQKKGTSYAWIGYEETGDELWDLTYVPTPGAPNNYQEFKPCEDGKVLNTETGNCVKATVVTEKTCAEGYHLNEETGRCNKNTDDDSTTAECKEGYYRDPTTNRCRKSKENDGAEYALAPTEYNESSSFVALYAVIGVAVVGGGYLIYEFRHDIGRAFGKIRRKVVRR